MQLEADLMLWKSITQARQDKSVSSSNPLYMQQERALDSLTRMWGWLNVRVAYERVCLGHKPCVRLIVFQDGYTYTCSIRVFSGYIHYNLLSLDKICK